MSLWDDARNLVTKAAHTVEGGVKAGLHAAAEWAGGLFGDGGRLGRATSIDEAVKAMLAGSSKLWHIGARTASDLAEDHRALSSEVLAFAGKFESAWTGHASDAAQARMKKLSSVLNVTSDTLADNSGNVTNVASHFDSTQKKMVPLPDKPPEKSFLDAALPWDTDTEKSIGDYNQTSKQNAEAYNSYATSTRTQAKLLTGDYGTLGEFDAGEVTLIPGPGTPDAKRGPVKGFGADRSDRDTGPGTATPPSSRPAPSSGPAPVTPGFSTNAGPGEHTATPAPVPHPAAHEETTTSGWTPPATSPGPVSPGPGVPSLGVPSGPETRAANPYFEGGWNPGAVPGSGPGAGGRTPGGGGSGSGTGGAPGAGRQTGMRGVPGEPGPVSGAGSSRAGGRPGSTPGMMPPGGARGKSEEDRERQRKYVQDDDALFTEKGDKLVDPETGYPAVPPTIGK
ncbi:hypothetical protein [Amycolatopsis alba]|uniref:hypothetical protein n=1 Tax=Amycolatopsis alba TaxID=76020 RepID=UPI00039F7FFB|nr:hypothetical protein [Amycolatopsis alba]